MKKIIIAIIWALAVQVQGDNFNLTGSQIKDISTSYDSGYLFDNSTVNLFVGANIHELYSHDSSKINISGGSLYHLDAYDTSNVNIYNGNVSYFSAYGNNIVNIFNGSVNFLYSEMQVNGFERVKIAGGNIGTLAMSTELKINDRFCYTGQISDLATYGINAIEGAVTRLQFSLTSRDSSSMYISGNNKNSYYLYAYDSSQVDINGGAVQWLEAHNNSTVTFCGKDFILGDGLKLDSNRLIGTGYLSGKWLNGISFTTRIWQNDDNANIFLVPEPTTLSLLGLGLLALRRKK